MAEDNSSGKEEHKTHHSSEGKESYTRLFKKNPWVLSTVVLGIVVLVLLVNVLGISGGSVSKEVAGKNLLDYYTANGASGLVLTNVSETSGVYQVNFNYKGAVVPMYVTKDGKLAGSLNQIAGTPSNSNTNVNTNTNQNVPKTDKPSVELYVFTYCPYGLQMEKAVLPVVKQFGDLIDFKIRQIGAMHGEFEKIEAQRQLCIEQNYPDKLWDYMLGFANSENVGNCNGDANCVAPLIGSLYTQLGIVKSKIDSCIPSIGLSLYNAEISNANAKSVGGSPTVLINGVESSVSRSQEGFKQAVCAAFNTPPELCSQTFTSESPGPGFGVSAGSGSAVQCAV